MSQAVYWTPSEEDQIDVLRFNRRPPGAGPSAMAVSLTIFALATVLSGSAVAWRLQQYEAVDTAAMADLSPQQVSLPPEDFADAQVVHGRLVVLTPPAYVTGVLSAVPVSAQIESPATVEALTHEAAVTDVAAWQNPDAAPETQPEKANAEMPYSEVSADPAPAESF